MASASPITSGLDPISAPLVLLTGLLVPLAIACSFTSIKRRVREYYAWLLALTAGMMGVFAARDLLLFYIFFEFTLIPLYFLIGIWGGSERRYGSQQVLPLHLRRQRHHLRRHSVPRRPSG